MVWTFKNIILTLLQVPFVVLRLFAACLEYLTVRCLAALSNPLYSPLAETRTARMGPPNLARVIGLLKKQNSLFVRRTRLILETTEAGRQAKRYHPDRRLYAVLRPTKAEDLKRIENVFNLMDDETRQRVLKNTEYCCTS